MGKKDWQRHIMIKWAATDTISDFECEMTILHHYLVHTKTLSIQVSEEIFNYFFYSILNI